MNQTKQPLLSVVIPAFNEQEGLQNFHNELLPVVKAASKASYEIIYVDDGSSDDTLSLVANWHAADPKVQVLRLSRNFGKEIAVSAGVHAARGQAILTLDADGQHPVELIPEFIKQWQAGSVVVVGLRTANKNEGLVKRYGSKLFYSLFSKMAGITLQAGATDFRLIDHTVQQEFIRLSERRRMTRALIDWLGYPQTYVSFTANPRLSGTAGYSLRKLFALAIDSAVSMSLTPLYISAYLGAIVLPGSLLLGLGMLVNALASDPLGLHATGSAYVMVFVLFLIGILLVSQGIIGLYLSHIHTETQNRPLYVIDSQRSVGVSNA